MKCFAQSKPLVVVAAWFWAVAPAAVPATAQQPDSATINGTIGSPVFGDHTWTLTLQGLSYSYHYPGDQYLFGSMTRVYATSFDFEFHGPHAEELNTNVSEPLVSGGLQNEPFVQLISFRYFDEDWDWWVDARNWYITVDPSDYLGLSFKSESSYGGEGGIFATDTNGYPVLAPFTSFGAHTSVYDNRPGSGYSMGIYPDGTVSVSSVTLPLPGDYNRDGAVDAADYVAWRKSLGGDPSGYGTWRTHFGQPTGGDAAMGAAANISVPEPSSLALLTLAASAILGLRKYPRI